MVERKSCNKIRLCREGGEWLRAGAGDESLELMTTEFRNVLCLANPVAFQQCWLNLKLIITAQSLVPSFIPIFEFLMNIKNIIHNFK